MKSIFEHIFVLACIYLSAAFIIILSRFSPIEFDSTDIIILATGIFVGYASQFYVGENE
jgi:hypothetical protein